MVRAKPEDLLSANKPEVVLSSLKSLVREPSVFDEIIHTSNE